MRCLSCNKNLNDRESVRKHAVTGEYLDLCNYCLRQVIHIQPIPINGSMDLAIIPDEDKEDDPD
jgi:hypothetical protein